jgi:hypothetical protein
MVGFNQSVVPYSVYSLISDNIRLNEVKNSPEEAKQYGIDYLFQETRY